MVPLAVSGVIAIGTVVAGGVLLLVILLRVEARDAAAEEADARARASVNDDRPAT
jgi:Flp pilus assembly protein protease CpaA